MKQVKLSWLIILVAGILGIMSVNALAADPSIKPGEPYYKAITGTIKNVNPQADDKDYYLIDLADEKGQPLKFIIRKDTYIDPSLLQTFKANTKVVGFVPTNSPMTMIFPPQYPVVAVMAKTAGFIKADRFDANGLSQDGQLKIRVGSTTDVILQDGKEFSGSIANRNLIVYYGSTTRSIPAQTTPIKVIVMFDKAVAPVAPMDPPLRPINRPTTRPAGGLEKPVPGTDVSKLAIVVNGKMTPAKAYQKANGDVMIPARIVLQNLSYKTVWDVREDRLFINDGISSLKAGENRYIFGRMAPIVLQSAPEIRSGTMYAPLEYFQKVLKIKNAYIFEGQIVLDNRAEVEKMQ